ncbi:retrotransposon protein, putative, ty1-copia subclass [Tanacetum coccineum]
MLMCMTQELQKNLEHFSAYDMLKELKKSFHACKQEEGQYVSSYVLKMKSYIDNLECLGHPMSLKLAVSFILISMSKEYDKFVQNYDMHGIEKTKKNNKNKKRLKVVKGKNQGKEKTKLDYAPNPKISPPSKKDNPAKDAICHQCGEVGYWRRNYPYNKRAKLNLDSTLLRHYRLGHINKKCIEKLQHDGLLKSTDDESFDKCVSFLSRKMARGGEFMSQEFLDHLKEHGIVSQCTPPYTPQHNGVFEWRNRTLLDMVHSMMSQTTLPKSFRDYALESVARILNMVPTKKVDKTPYERSLITQEASGSLEDLEVIQEEDMHPSENTSLHHDEDKQEIVEPQSDVNPVHRSTRTRYAPDRMCLYVDAKEHELGDHNEPTKYKAILSDPESKKWLEAMNMEMQSLVDLPPNGKTVGSKWIFKKKTNMAGNVHTYKAHLVAKVFTQTYGVDYKEPFSLVADIRAIGILIGIVVFYDYDIWQIDVKTAFLNGYLSQEVYMVHPKDFVNLKYPNQVCKLKCSIYELKQASRQWNKQFDEEIRNEKLIMENCIPMLQGVKSYLGKCFAMKDLGEETYILGIKIYRDRSRSKTQGASTPDEVKRMKRVPYASAVGSIMYAVRCTRLDVAFAQNLTSRFQPNSGAVDWKSAKESIIATSSTEAKYMAASKAFKEAVWIRKFI